MFPELSKIKGVHPGAILKRALSASDLKAKELADSLGEYAQTISAILNERRGMNAMLSIQLGRYFGIDEDYFMLLQASYEVKKASQAPSLVSPDLSIIRKALFWDTDFQKINWTKDKKPVIKRILERGNDNEINEIIHFYGLATIKEEMKYTQNDFLPSFNENLEKYNIRSREDL